MINFYPQFLRHCSTLTYFLYDLHKRTNNKTTMTIPVDKWTDKHNHTFDRLKVALSKSTKLTFPHMDCYTCLVTDALDTAAGAMLKQWINNSWNPLGFFSCSFTVSELKYSTYDHDLLVVKLALAHFRHLIEGIRGSIEASVARFLLEYKAKS